MGFTICLDLDGPGPDGPPGETWHIRFHRGEVFFNIPDHVPGKDDLGDPRPWLQDVSILATVFEAGRRLQDDELRTPVLAAATAGLAALAAQLPSGAVVQRDGEVFTAA